MVVFNNKFDSEVSKALNSNTFKRLWWVFVLCSGLFILLGASGIAFREDSSDLMFGIVMIVFGVLFTPLTFILTHFMQKKVDKSMSIMSSETQSVFTFDANKFTITQTKGDDYYARTEATYGYLFKVTENADCYFLYISRYQSHVIFKSGLTEGTLQEFNSYLAQNLGEKFKYKK